MAETVMPMTGVERNARAVEKVNERLLRSTAALNAANVSYALVGALAVAEHVMRVEEAAVRNTRDVDLLIRRADLDAVKAALEPVGFIYAHVLNVHMFLDGPTGRAQEAVHIIFANEKVLADQAQLMPDVNESEQGPRYPFIKLLPLVKMKLTANRDKDRTHVRDMIDVGLIDAGWLDRLPPELAARLKHILDTPGG